MARRLGVSIATVRRLESSGRLPHELDGQGVHTFKASDVEALATEQPPSPGRIDPAERAARAWDLLASGASVFDLVSKLRLHPDEAQKLAAGFAAPGAVVLPDVFCRELASLGFGDEMGRVTPSSLVAAARAMKARLRAYRAAPATRAAQPTP